MQSTLRLENTDLVPTVVWLTGRPCAGKSTVALLVADSVRAHGRSARILDGDELRRTVSAGLGFSAEDRCEHARRAASEAARVLDAGALPIVALISPLRKARAEARGILAGALLEVYVAAPVSVCAARDLKGMYARARQGALREFTGVSSPYEPPDAPDLHLDTVVEEPTESAHRVMTMLKARGAL